MKKSAWMIISLAILVAMAITAYFGANHMIDSIYEFRSPISATPPQPGQPVTSPASEKVVLVLIDALRFDTSNDPDVMPFLNQLRSIGAYAAMHSQTPSYSAPGYSTLLIGAWPYMHDGPAFNLEYDDIPVWTQDNLVSAAHRNGVTTGISAFNWFEKLVPQNSVDLSFYTPGEDNSADEEVVVAAISWLEEPGDQFILIHIDQVDYAGHHEGGAAGQGWRDAAQRADKLLERIASKLDLQKDTIIVLSDHGQIDPGGHGGHEAVTLLEPFVMAGNAIIPGNYPDMQMVDVAPTIAALLGANFPASSTGRVLSDMLALPPDVLSQYQTMEEGVHSNVASLYSSAIGISFAPGDTMESLRDSRLARERSMRLPVVILLLLLPPLLMIVNKVRNAKFWLAGAVIAFLGFQIRYALIDGRHYSFSAILDPTELIIYCAITALTTTFIGFIVAALVGKPRHSSVWDAAGFVLGFSFTAIYIWLVPFGWSFWVNGFTPTWTLPQLDSYFWGLLSLVVVIITAVTGILITILYPLLTRLRRKTRV